MILTLGEILLRLNTVSQQKLEQASLLEARWGGSEANVLINLSLLGLEGRMLTKLPDSPLGTAALSLLKAHGVDTSFITRGPGRLGLYFLEEGTSVRSGKIIYDRENATINELTPESVLWEALFEGITWVHWSGITPALSANAAATCQKMISMAATRGIPVSCDLHYRKNLWNYGKKPREVIVPLLEQTTHLVGDPAAIRDMTGAENDQADRFLSDAELYEVFAGVIKRYSNLRSVSMLSRHVINASEQHLHGLLFNGEGYASPHHHITPVRDRIGSGDAFMAGMIHGWIRGMKEYQMISWATALAAYKHTIPGDQLAGSLEDFEQFAEGNKGKINR